MLPAKDTVQVMLPNGQTFTFPMGTATPNCQKFGGGNQRGQECMATIYVAKATWKKATKPNTLSAKTTNKKVQAASKAKKQ